MDGKKSDKGERVSRRLCPVFNGDGVNPNEYELWKKRVEWWYLVEGKNCDCLAGDIILSLGEKVFESVCDLKVQELDKDEGVKKILLVLDEKYGKEEQRDRYDRILEFFYVKRQDNESIREYVNRYEVIESRCKMVGKVDLGEDLKCVHLLEGANVDRVQRQMVLASVS